MDTPGPAALIQRLGTDPAAWGPLWALVGDDLRRSVARTVGADLADDAVQEAALAVAVHAGRFRVPAGADPDRAAGIWLRAVAIHAALDLARGRRRAEDRHARAAAREPSPMPDPDPIQAAELRAAVQRALADLPPAMALAVALRHLDGHDTADTARILGRPEGTVKTLVARGLARLRGPLRPHAPAVALAALAGWDPGPLGIAAGGRSVSRPPAGRPAPFPILPSPMHRRLLLMTLPVLAAVLAAVALWPAPARAADPVAPPAWWTADALEAIGDGATVAMHIIVPPGRSLAAGDASEFPPLDRSLLERTRSLTLILQGDVGMAVFDGPGVGDPEVVAAIEGRCRAAGWRTDPATVAGIAARRLGAGVGGSLGMHLEIATTGSGAVLATQGRLAIRPRLTWRGGEGPGDFPGVVLLAAGSGRLVMVPGDDRHLAEWITASGTVPATATGAWMRRMMAEQRDGGAVVVAAGKVLGPPIAVAVVPDGPRIRLVGACRMPDAAQAAMLVDTLERAAAAADTLAAELAPHIRRFMVVRGTPEPGAIEASMHEIEQGIAGTIASTQVVPDGDQVRLVTRLGGQALDDLLMGITGVQ